MKMSLLFLKKKQNLCARKIIFACIFCLFINSNPFSQNFPSLLKGLWEGSDRIVLFSDSSEKESITDCSIVLKTFYGWYDDRNAEPEYFSKNTPRDRNNTTSKESESMIFTIETICEDSRKTCGAYLLTFYFGKESITIPAAVLDQKLYLNFLVKEKNSEGTGENFMNGFWRNPGNANGILSSKGRNAKELQSIYFNNNDVYHIRYWQTDMEAGKDEIKNAKAEFTDGKNTFYVDKFIQTGNLLYTCTTGRSKTIRNIQKSHSNTMKFTVDDEKTICILEKEYLAMKNPSATENDLMKTVIENNKLKHPAPKPLFPPSKVNFHFKEISELEKYNPYTWNKRNIDIHK